MSSIDFSIKSFFTFILSCMSDFIESLNSKQFKDVEKFFETMPKLSHTIKVTNPETKVENEIVLEGLQSFFV